MSTEIRQQVAGRLKVRIQRRNVVERIKQGKDTLSLRIPNSAAQLELNGATHRRPVIAYQLLDL